jgi:hypothetical protein
MVVSRCMEISDEWLLTTVRTVVGSTLYTILYTLYCILYTRVRPFAFNLQRAPAARRN